MELRHLRYFKVVAELEHFHKAANALFITQPALSNQIKQLEDELGSKLFDRIGRGVRLSESGKRVLHSAQKILSEIETLRGAVEDLESGSAGKLNVGVLQSVNALYLSNIVIEFDLHHPNVSLQVNELSNNEIESRVSQGEIDIGIGFVLNKEYENIQTEVLFREKWKLVVAREHEERIGDIISGKCKELKAVLLPECYETRKIINSYFEQKNNSPAQITEVNSISCILDLVTNGNSFTILPEAFSIFKARDKLTTHYIDDITPRQVGILTAKDRILKRSAKKFQELVYSQLYTAK